MNKVDGVLCRYLDISLLEACSPQWFPRSIDQGWATLIAAFFGLVIVAWQARQGFKLLMLQQKKQSELDREARNEQATLEQAAETRRELTSAKSLAMALAAELMAAHAVVMNSRRMTPVVVQILKAWGEEKVGEKFPLTDYLPQFDPLVYKANVGDIGLLGPSTAHDVVDVYNALLLPASLKPTPDLSGRLMAELLLGYDARYTEWLTDCFHVHGRLMSITGAGKDPGPLYLARRDRRKATKDTQVNENALVYGSVGVGPVVS